MSLSRILSRTLQRTALTASLLAALQTAHAAPPLGQYNIDTSQISVSGISAGGFMAAQLGFAHSSLFMGVGVFAAGPYLCAAQNNYTGCMYNATVSSARMTSMQNAITASSGSTVDPVSNLANQKVYLFTGTTDSVVGSNLTTAAHQQYQANGVPAAQLSFVQRASTAHVFPTDFSATGNNACNSSSSPYIANCGYDGAHAVLSHIYGMLQPRNNAPAAANYLSFDQTAFSAGNPGMANDGWIYVPSECASGTQQCRLHVALHGCKQEYDSIGDQFLKNTGYTRWADTNRIIVLFPQAKADSGSRSTAASGSLPNPNACWDWVGWYGSDFARKSGKQIAAIKAMVDRVASGEGSGPGTGGGGEDGETPPEDTLPAPAALSTSAVTDTSVTLNWSAVPGADGYNLYRGSVKVNALRIYGTSYTDNGLSPSTAYSWTVRAVDASEVEGAASAPASATTLAGSAPPAAECFTASNYAHTLAGRAYALYGQTYAAGSNAAMGLWNIFITTTLKKTGPLYYEIGTCP